MIIPAAIKNPYRCTEGSKLKAIVEAINATIATAIKSVLFFI